MITFDGIDLSSLGARITRDAPSTYAARDVETEEIPGRNGAIVYDNGAYKNVSQPYTLYIPRLNKRATARQIAAWLLSHSDTYYTLFDDYEPDVYRMARYAGGLEIESRLERYGSAELVFDCKPQRFFAINDITVYPVVRGYLNSSGAMIAGDENDRRTGYMPVQPGDELTLSISYEYMPDDNTTGMIIAAYSNTGDAGSYYLSKETKTPTAPGSTSYTYTVPAGAYFVIVAWKSSYATVHIKTPSSSAEYSADGAVINNDSLFEASPIVTLKQGNSNISAPNVQGFSIGNTRVTLVMTGIATAIFDNGLVVDCDSMNVYAKYIGEVVSENNKTTVYDIANSREADKFPVFAPGENVLNTYGATMGFANECPITEIVITPRWWTI